MFSWLMDAAAGLLFLVVLLTTNNIYLATGAGVAAGVATLAWTWARHRRVEAVQLIGPAIVLVMGGATLLLHDPRFVMIKPSIIQAGVGVVMLRPGWMYRFLPAAAAEAPRRLIVGMGYAYAATMFVLAGGNLVVAFLASQRTWALFSTAAPWIVVGLLGLVNWQVIKAAVVSARRAQPQAC